MAWNPSPDIAALRDFSKKFDRPIVVTFSIDAKGDKFHMTTFGRTKELCKLAGAFGSQISDAIMRGEIAPPEVEPFEVPPQSVAWKRIDKGGDS